MEKNWGDTPSVTLTLIYMYLNIRGDFFFQQILSKFIDRGFDLYLYVEKKMHTVRPCNFSVQVLLLFVSDCYLNENKK